MSEQRILYVLLLVNQLSTVEEEGLLHGLQTALSTNTFFKIVTKFF